MAASTVNQVSLSRSPEETEVVGRALAQKLKAGDVVALWGELGAGKTCLVRGLAQGLGLGQAVTSPTFTLINEYPGPCPLYHFDLYRLKGPAELEDLGCDDYFFGIGICVLEWAQKALEILPAERWEVRIEILADEQRRITIIAPDSKRPAC